MVLVAVIMVIMVMLTVTVLALMETTAVVSALPLLGMWKVMTL
jgi:hypothetical protein